MDASDLSFCDSCDGEGRTAASSPRWNPSNFESGTFELGHGHLSADFAPKTENPEMGAPADRRRPEIGTKAEKEAGECGFSTPGAFRHQATCAELSSD